jgi:hypothetical protein
MKHLENSCLKEQKNPFYKHTQFMFVGSKLFLSPLDAMYSILAFIFCKDLNATPFQITLLVTLKPLVALFSFYSTSLIREQPQRLKSFLVGANLLGCFPCLFFPFVTNVWFFLFSFALFMVTARAKIPAWTEILKINLSSEARGKIFSRGASLSYLSNLIVPLLISPIIDRYSHSWKWIFFILALLQILNVLLLLCLKLKTENFTPLVSVTENIRSLSTIILQPWKNCWELMRQRPDFKKFQIVFMFGGAGLMIMHPVLPIFFKETLQLSYTSLTLAICFCKGISFALTSSIWGRWINRISIHLFNFYVTFFAGLFALLIIASTYNLNLIYAAYILYGTMQAGSELSWNLSGPIFSKEKDSTLFTGVNVAMVGLRGCLAPLLGEILFVYFSSSFVFGCGGGLCFVGAMYSLWLALSAAKVPDQPIKKGIETLQEA